MRRGAASPADGTIDFGFYRGGGTLIRRFYSASRVFWFGFGSEKFALWRLSPFHTWAIKDFGGAGIPHLLWKNAAGTCAPGNLQRAQAWRRLLGISLLLHPAALHQKLLSKIVTFV
jgi:hypothetical protein